MLWTIIKFVKTSFLQLYKNEHFSSTDNIVKKIERKKLHLIIYRLSDRNCAVIRIEAADERKKKISEIIARLFRNRARVTDISFSVSPSLAYAAHKNDSLPERQRTPRPIQLCTQTNEWAAYFFNEFIPLHFLPFFFCLYFIRFVRFVCSVSLLFFFLFSSPRLAGSMFAKWSLWTCRVGK